VWLRGGDFLRFLEAGIARRMHRLLLTFGAADCAICGTPCGLREPKHPQQLTQKAAESIFRA
jgi:hypothetical protein